MKKNTIAKDTVRITLITLVAGFALGLVNEITKAPIAQQEAKAKAEACKAVFADALKATANHRGTTQQIADVSGILHNIEESQEMRSLWEKYRKQFAYAQEIDFVLIISILRQLLFV